MIRVVFKFQLLVNLRSRKMTTVEVINEVNREHAPGRMQGVGEAGVGREEGGIGKASGTGTSSSSVV